MMEKSTRDKLKRETSVYKEGNYKFHVGRGVCEQQSSTTALDSEEDDTVHAELADASG